MNKQVRLTILLDMITEQGFITVDDIQKNLGVSAATARRDLDSLATQQLITRTRGGAMANATSGDIPLGYKSTRQAKQKQAISKEVTKHITPGSVIAFNGGTTTASAAFEVGVVTTADSAFDTSPVTVVTNAVNIANDLTFRPNIRVVVIGGVARSRSYELIGPLADAILEQIHIGTLFLGVDAIDPVRGFFTHNDGEAAINAQLVNTARRTIVIADHTKFTSHAFAQICPIDAVDLIITDSGVSPDTLADYAGIVDIVAV